MALKYYETPFHATHDNKTASKMAMKVDLSIMLSKLITAEGWTQIKAAEELGVTQSRISELANSKVDKFSLDAMFDMLDKLGFSAEWSMKALDKASISISRRKLATA